MSLPLYSIPVFPRQNYSFTFLQSMALDLIQLQQILPANLTAAWCRAGAQWMLKI